MFCPRWGGGARGGPRSAELAQADAPLLVGVFGWGQSTQAAVWPELVVILAPSFDQVSGFGEPEEKMFVQTLVTKLLLKLSMKAFCTGLPGSM